MSHQDCMDRCTTRHSLKDLLQFLLPPSVGNCPRHGNAKIPPLALAAMAIACWGWSAKRTLAQRVAEAAAAMQQLGWSRQTVSRQGLLKALASCGSPLATRISEHVLGRLVQLKGHWRTAGRATFAIDGTKFSAPRSRQNQARFAMTKNGTRNRRGRKYKSAGDAKKASSVQVLLTVFWHIGSGLPACWRMTNSHGSERKQAEEMLHELPPAARIVGDAEYTGYPLWSAILNSGRAFVVRVGSNVTLLKKLDPKAKRKRDLVYCWPAAAQSDLSGVPPLVLKLLEVQTSRGSMYLLTNELDLTNQQICELYRARWGIEVFFRTVKQNCHRAKLLCQTPTNVETELTWTLLGIWSALFVAKLALHDSRQPLTALSPIRVLDTLRTCLAHLQLGLLSEIDLTTCIKPDESRRSRSKQSRDYPCKKKRRRCGVPKLRDATPDQILAAKQYLG